MSNFTKPSDQSFRDRFINELDKNFSVIAPAGVGKTEAIIRRVINLATMKDKNAPKWLSKLVVVTYTNKAANEMRQRAGNEILKQNVDEKILGAFNQAFFGTIHQFCLKLLNTYGYYLGLPGNLELVKDEEILWLEFVRQVYELDGDPETIKKCLRHLSALDIINAGRNIKIGIGSLTKTNVFPNMDFAPLLSHPPNNRSKGSVEEGQNIIRGWINELEKGNSYIPIPEYSKGGADFQKCWQNTFAPIRKWLSECSTELAMKVGLDFRNYRLSKKQLTFEDQICLASELVSHPEAGNILREEGYRIILDEAQDTDPLQFKVLLELSRPPGSDNDWIETGNNPPRPGHFCMVGDFQQSIYSDRADLAFYSKIHNQLISGKSADKLTFSVTFRCDKKIIDCVNKSLPSMLDGKDGQVEYVKLEPRPDITEGQVIRWIAEPVPYIDDKTSVNISAVEEARQIAKWIRKEGLKKLRASKWSDVAILCPRKRWFPPFVRELRKVAIETQVQSTNDIYGDSPAYAWFAALMVIFAEADNSYEIVGVLREIFGHSDQQLADYSLGNGELFQINDLVDKQDEVAQTLNQLVKIRQEVIKLPLRDCVNRIVDAVNLRERLDILPDYSEGMLIEELDGLLMKSAEAEFKKLSLPEWAEILKTDFYANREEEQIKENCLQLITCQKAKGLQWNAVIIPSLYRKIMHRNPTYPEVIYRAYDKPPAIAFSNEDKAPFKNEIEEKRIQELERLLYVAMTRAKRTLVLADSNVLFKKQSGIIFAGLLGFDNPENNTTWQNLPTELTIDAESPIQSVDEKEIEKIEPVTKTLLNSALEYSDKFYKRELPSKKAKHSSIEEPEYRNELDSMEEDSLQPRELALDYGTWWHKAMESIDWYNKETWDSDFRISLKKSPNPERAKHEWKLFLESDLAKKLSNKNLIIHVEMPVLFKKSDELCVEGIIDLAVYDEMKKEWHVVDWKTDKVDNPETLKTNYSPQIETYVSTLEKITNIGAHGSIYSTTRGELVNLK